MYLKFAGLKLAGFGCFEDLRYFNIIAVISWLQRISFFLAGEGCCKDTSVNLQVDIVFIPAQYIELPKSLYLSC